MHNPSSNVVNEKNDHVEEDVELNKDNRVEQLKMNDDIHHE